MAAVSKRRGLITNTETRGDLFIMQAEVSLSQMFGFATELRSLTQGQGEFSMEYKRHQAVAPQEIEDIKKRYQQRKSDKETMD